MVTLIQNLCVLFLEVLLVISIGILLIASIISIFFSEKPQAECFCKNCKYYKNIQGKAGICLEHNNEYTSEEWFCWRAKNK